MTSRVRLAAWVIGALVLASSMNVAGLVIVFAKLSSQANDGAHARMTQCDREPVTRKLAQTAFEVRGQLPSKLRISQAELDRFMRQAPRNCP